MSFPLKDKILQRLDELGIHAKRSLGQNFLVSESVVEKIVSQARPEDFPSLVEVGPGLGSLTETLANKNENIELIELDEQLAHFWSAKGFSVHKGDVLKYPWESISSKEPLLMVSNLPYQIGGRLLVDLSLRAPIFSRLVFMFQKEVAQRILAGVGTADYSLLSVVAQSFWQIKKVTEAGPRDFYPTPKVASRVLLFDRQAVDTSLLSPKFLELLRLSFSQRRKKLLPRLKSRYSQETLQDFCQKQGWSPDIRPQELSPRDYQSLYRGLETE